ncbi:MAG: hypothetical protein GF364_03180 [Candidatus Lokiarchaeota archaeon]|nr:hypothetical protein [Candidatus Lokiarchaeota archaeon]
MKKSGVPNIKRDASIALDYILRKYGSTEPNDFLLPEWKGDFRGIKKKVMVAFRTNNVIEIQQIIKRMNTVLSTNNDEDVREDAAEMLCHIGKIDKRLIEPYEQHYIEAILTDSERDVKKSINSLLKIIDSSYPDDYEKTVEQLSKRAQLIKIKTDFSFDNDFIRYKVKIVNNTKDILWDVRYKIKKYEKNFMLREIKPDTLETYKKYLVNLSVVQPGDVKELIAIVEPRASEVYLEGNLHYKKYNENDFNKLLAPDLIVNLLDAFPKLEEIKEKPSIIHCREFFDFHGKYKSMNVFALPVSVTPELAYKIGKRVLSDIGFTLIRDDIVDQENFYGEGLFYGRTNPDPKNPELREEIVIIPRASHENYALEINIGCNNNAYLVAIQIKFDNLFRQILIGREEFTEDDRLYELRCPNCFQPFDKLDRDWCPWCGEDIDKTKLLY